MRFLRGLKLRPRLALADMKIGLRLTLAFSLVLLLLAGVVGIATLQLDRLSGVAKYYAFHLVPASDVQKQLATGVATLRRLEYQHILLSTEAEKKEIDVLIEAEKKKIDAQLARYAKELVADPTDAEALDKVKASIASYYTMWVDNVRGPSRDAVGDPGKIEEAMSFMSGSSLMTFEALSKALAVWSAHAVKLAQDQQTASALAGRKARLLLLGVAGLAGLLGAAAAVLITRSIVVPLRQAVAMARTVAAGDLSVRIEVRGKDEAAQLLEALGSMNDSLVRIVGEVRNSSDSIATGSVEIATGNADLSHRTEEQASNLQQTASSMEQLTGTVQANTQTAQTATQLAACASSAAVKGGTAVAAIVATMQEIAGASRKIGDITGVIDSIAFQTNILALNAAVEAARAGEHGRGFAVVAAEVRSLAQRAAGAAKEIKALIGNSVDKVETGTRQANEAGHTMGDIVSQVESVSKLISEISSATQEQSHGIVQVNGAVTLLDQATQQNAALVEQSAAAAESLKRQAAHLAEVMSMFKLKQETADA
jgi:methyl-accepting chemotaxis protein